MFRARMKEHSIQKPIKKEDGLGFAFDGYEEPERVSIYISKPTATAYAQNEFYTQRYEATGYSLEELPLGTLIDGSWKVESCEGFKFQYVLGLSRIAGAANE